MSALEKWRAEIRPLIPRGFLRRDLGEGLFISDFPRFPEAEKVCAALEKQGFRVDIDKSVARLDGTMEKYRALQQGLKRAERPLSDGDLPLFSLACRLIREDVPLDQQPLSWIHFTLKCLDEGTEGELLRQLSGGAALLLRQHQPLPALAGELILDHLCHWVKGAEETC